MPAPPPKLPTPGPRLGAVLAPGKAFLSGEYAVLRGAPALVQALGVYVRATWLGPAALAVARPRGADPLLRHVERAVRRHLRTQRGRRPPAGGVRVDSAALYDGLGRPWGVGSSAACSAATATCLALAAGLDPTDAGVREGLLPAAIAGHRAHQGGRGSGADVAASLLGGVVLFGGAAACARLPDGLPVEVAVLRGPEATRDSTPELVGRVLSAPARARDALLDELCAAASSVAGAAQRGDAASFLDGVNESRRLLGALGRLASVAICCPHDEQLARRLGPLGVAVKPSGAGGGELTLLAARDRATLAFGVAAAHELGLESAGPLDQAGARLQV